MKYEWLQSMINFWCSVFVYLLLTLTTFADTDRDVCTHPDSDKTSSFMACLNDAKNTNHPVSQTFVAGHYYFGHGTTQNYKEAVRWFQLAAEQGLSHAQYYLGIIYKNGEGVEKNDVIAYMWMNIAAESGSEKASDGRNIISDNMTDMEIEKAEELSQECLKKKYKNCY